MTASEAAPKVVRSYQQRALDRLSAGGNMLLVLPTGAGKTEVALRRAVVLLEADPEAKTIFVVNNVALVPQQTGIGSAE